MAQRPDGKAAKTQASLFTQESARRIARVVRKVESGDRSSQPLRFDRVVGGGGKVFRMCTYTGTWGVNQNKTVTFLGVTATPNTVVARNVIAQVNFLGGTRSCAIARDGTSWFLIASECVF